MKTASHRSLPTRRLSESRDQGLRAGVLRPVRFGDRPDHQGNVGAGDGQGIPLARISEAPRTPAKSVRGGLKQAGASGLITTWCRDGVSLAGWQRSSAKVGDLPRSILVGASLRAQSAVFGRRPHPTRLCRTRPGRRAPAPALARAAVETYPKRSARWSIRETAVGSPTSWWAILALATAPVAAEARFHVAVGQ